MLSTSPLAQADLYVNTSSEIEAHKSVNGLFGRLNNVNKTFVSADFVLITSIFVNVWRNQYGEALFVGGQGDRTTNLCTSTLGGFHDLSSGLID